MILINFKLIKKSFVMNVKKGYVFKKVNFMVIVIRSMHYLGLVLSFEFEL